MLSWEGLHRHGHPRLAATVGLMRGRGRAWLAPTTVGLWERGRPNAFHVRPGERMTRRSNRLGGLLWRLRGWHRVAMASSNRVLTDLNRRLLAGTRTSHRGVTC